jgi:hypothetical protein
MMIVFAGISLACVCYMNPDGSDAWCEPDGCNEEGSYCVETGSTCKIGTKTLTCCEGRCVSNKCVVTTTTSCAKTYVCDSNIKSTTPNCCDEGYCWNTKTTPNGCSVFTHCPNCFKTVGGKPVPLTPIDSAYWINPDCWWPVGNPYIPNQEPCCLDPTKYDGTILVPMKIKIW